MTQRLTFDFSRPATLAYELTSSARFLPNAELGRASAILGTGDGAVRAVATYKGSYANGRTLHLMTRDDTRVEVDGNQIRLVMASGLTAEQAAEALLDRQRNPALAYGRPQPDALTSAIRAQRRAAVIAPFLGWGVDLNGGSGSDPAPTGVATFAGGADPNEFSANSALYESSATDAGLYVFDSEEPLKFEQFAASLGGSVAWALTLRRLGPGWGDSGQFAPIASGTGQNVLVTDRNVIIPPGWGIGFSADTTGFAMVTVRRA